jgi:thiamine pyrophosphate-dependent acetolactate synthase large subunit-like protein
VVISSNNSLGQILCEQMVLGCPEHGVRFPPPAADFAAWATACGGYGAKAGNPKKVQGAIRDALAPRISSHVGFVPRAFPSVRTRDLMNYVRT